MTHSQGDTPTVVPTADLDGLQLGPFDQESGMLRIGKCAVCGTETVPPSMICHVCGSADIGIELRDEIGSLYSYTTVHVSPSMETPYVLGYVDLPGGLRVLGHVVADAAELTCDLPVRAVRSSSDSTGWAFVPATKEAA